ncbi:hypothetical protein GGI43DRAFT_406221 [Trichoderma evansii]
MRILGPDQTRWEWFVALHPLYEQALPSKQLLAKIRATPRLLNDVVLICQVIRAIPIVLPNVDLDRDLEQSKYDSFSKALVSMLEVLEALVMEDVPRSSAEQHNAMAPEELELYTKYPKLAALMSMLRHSESRIISTMASDRSKTSSHEALAELAVHIDYIGIDISPKYSSRDIATKISTFKSQIETIFADPLEALERDLGNASIFSHKEIEFIRRAHKLNTLSQSLFKMLVESITCSKAHKARLHLSGFLDSEINFELLITKCEQKHWNVANCRFVDREWTRSSGRATHGLLCAHPELTRASSETLRIAFNGEDMWDETQSLPMLHSQGADSIPTLHELLLPKRYDDDESGSELDKQEFVGEDQKIVELLVASSLLNLNASAWLRANINIKSILVESSPNLDRRWKPLVACSLEAINIEDEVQDAILSFGLLLMEMEGKKIARPKEADNDWETGLPSKDSMLRRIIEEWNRVVSDGYRHIATACLQFRELSARLYDPGLTQDMGQSAAIYKYILAPLHRLATQQHSKISPIFTNFPSSPQSTSATRNYPLRQATLSPTFVLFDGFDTHDPTAIKNATTFWEDTKSFRKMIENLSSSSTISALADSCRKEKIRIAIIDTGIDKDDTTIEGAIMDKRIKECCGFVNGLDAKPDLNDYEDQTGHGTHVARLMLKMAPSAELYIAKISNEFSIKPTDLHRVTRAIKWAHKDKHAHIISMSFGLGITQNVETDRAIVAAKRDGITMFAAAANSGGNKPRAYPSNRGSPVICVHASDGLGNDGGISPDPLPDEPNFSTLGISIASKWKGDDVFKSGTSFATPIAAALAADVLEFARYRCDLDEFEFNSLRDYDGICKILKLMARKRQGHDYLMPLHLWNGENDDEAIKQKLYRIAGR